MARSGMALLHDVLEDPKLNKQDKIYLVFDHDEHTPQELLECFDQAKNLDMILRFYSQTFASKFGS